MGKGGRKERKERTKVKKGRKEVKTEGRTAELGEGRKEGAEGTNERKERTKAKKGGTKGRAYTIANGRTVAISFV